VSTFIPRKKPHGKGRHVFLSQDCTEEEPRNGNPESNPLSPPHSTVVADLGPESSPIPNQCPFEITPFSIDYIFQSRAEVLNTFAYVIYRRRKGCGISNDHLC
jgi:hypothetical protein